MRSIIVPVNFSSNAADAARYAADMAASTGMYIHLVSVLELSNSDQLPNSIFEELLNSSLELLQRLADELRQRTGRRVPIATDLEVGDLHDKLSEFCRQVKPFVIVSGIASHSLGTTLQGSTTIKVLRHLPYPLLVIPEHTTYHAVRKIIVACDREDIHSGMGNAEPLLNELTKLFSPRFEMLHVLTEGEGNSEKLTGEYRSWCNNLEKFDPTLVFMRRPDVATGISDYLKDHPADWLLVFPKRHSWLDSHKSRAVQLITDSTLPILNIIKKK